MKRYVKTNSDFNPSLERYLDRLIGQDVWVLVEELNGLWHDPVWIKILDKVDNYDGAGYKVSRINVAYSDLYYVNNRNDHSSVTLNRLKLYSPLTECTTEELESQLHR